MKRITSLFLALICFATAVFHAPLSVRAASDHGVVVEMRGVALQNLKTGQYLNNDYGTLKNGNYVRVWPWDGSKEQLFDIDMVAANTYRLLTHASSKYAVDIYRGNAKLKAGQLCDIWKAGSDSIAQNIQFYACDDGSYILRMSNNPNLVLAATSAKGRVKLVKFNQNDSSQKWVFKDSNGNKVDITNATANAPVGIPSAAYKKTGIVYTVNDEVYCQAKTLRDYNGVAAGTDFYLNSTGYVVTDSVTLDRLYALALFNDMRSIQNDNAKQWVRAATAYYDIYKYIQDTEKMGSLIGKTTGILLDVGVAKNPFTLTDAAIEFFGEVGSQETFKSLLLLNMLIFYTNNTVAYGDQVSVLLKSEITDYEQMLNASVAYAECAANFAAVEYLAGDQIREFAESSTANEMKKYFENVFLGFADAVIPDIKAVEITKYVTDGVVAIADFAVSCGAEPIYQSKLTEQLAFLSKGYAGAKKIAEQLAMVEKITFVKPLSSKYTTNITTQKWAAYYSSYGYHLGVDLGTSGNRSTTVNVIADGVIYRIVQASKSGGWGNLVIVKHTLPNGKVFYSGYAHLKNFATLKEGQVVSAGTPLGIMGNTGISTGPHLHLMVFTGSYSKSQLPKGYASRKITGDFVTISGLTYYDPLKVISSNGAIIK